MASDMNKQAIEQVAKVEVVSADEETSAGKEKQMIRALYSAASGMPAQEMNVDNIANNLANANTVGYKARRAQFQDLMYQSVLQPGTSSGQQTLVPTGMQLGLGTRTTSNEIIFTQGAFSETDNPLDLVIQGSGFFQILQPNGRIGLHAPRPVPAG